MQLVWGAICRSGQYVLSAYDGRLQRLKNIIILLKCLYVSGKLAACKGWKWQYKLFTNNEKNKLNYQSDIYKLTQTHQLRVG
jgi:hypothetical protein